MNSFLPLLMDVKNFCFIMSKNLGFEIYLLKCHYKNITLSHVLSVVINCFALSIEKQKIKKIKLFVEGLIEIPFSSL